MSSKPDCFNFDAIDDNFYKNFGDKIDTYKTELGNNIKENGGNNIKYEKKTTFVNTYYLPIMYIIYSFIFKKFYDEQSKRQIIIYNIHQYNENRLLFDRQSPLVKKVNVFLNNKLSEEKKEEKEELESGIIQQIIENKDITVKFLENINEKLQKVIDLNKIHIKKYENFLNDLQTYSNKLDDVRKIEQAGVTKSRSSSGYKSDENNFISNNNYSSNDESSIPPRTESSRSSRNKKLSSKTLNKNISSIINNRLLQPTNTKKSNNTLIIKSKYEDLIKLQIKINLFLIMDNSDFTASLFIKTSNSTNIIAPIITAYTNKNQQILKMINEYKKNIEKNVYLIKLFEDIKELYQDYLQQINNKRIQKTFFDKIINKIKVIIYVIDETKYTFIPNNKTNIKKVINTNGYLKSKSGGYLNTENNLLPLINLIYDNIIQNIQSELIYLSLNTPQTDQVASHNSSNPQNIIFNQKTKKIDFDLKLRQYLKEKKDIDKIIVQKLKEFKGDIDDNLKNILNELTLLKDPLTPENKTEKPRLNTIKIQLENNLKTEQNNLKLSQSQIDSYNEEMKRLEDLISNESNKQKQTRLESSLEIQRQSLTKENKNYNLIKQKIKTIMSDIQINEEKLNKIIQKENQYKYKKEILETKQTSYINIKKEIDNNLSELEKPKEGLNNSTLKDLFNKTFNNLIQLTNNLSEINKKIQYKKSNNKISTLLDNDMLSKISLISKNTLNNNNNKNQAIFIKKITNYYTIKESKKSITNKNSSKIYIFMNSLLEEYNKIKDTKNTTVELFFQFIIKIDDELTKSIMKLLDKINQQKLKKINNSSRESKIQYLNTLSSKIKALKLKIITSGVQTSQNRINSAKQKSESKIKRILAYTDVIKLYFSNIIYLILYLSTYYL